MINTEGYFKAVTKYWLCCPQPLPVPLTKRPERKGKNKQKISKEKPILQKKGKQTKNHQAAGTKKENKKSKEKQIAQRKEKKYKKISNEKQISGRQRKQDPVADSSKDWLDQL